MTCDSDIRLEEGKWSDIASEEGYMVRYRVIGGEME